MIVRNSSNLPYLLEGLGTSILTYVILATLYSKNIIIVSVVYLIMLLMVSTVTHFYSMKHYPMLFFNPIITIVFSSAGLIPLTEFTPYILSQIIGGILGYEFYKYFTLSKK